MSRDPKTQTVSSVAAFVVPETVVDARVTSEGTETIDLGHDLTIYTGDVGGNEAFARKLLAIVLRGERDQTFELDAEGFTAPPESDTVSVPREELGRILLILESARRGIDESRSSSQAAAREISALTDYLRDAEMFSREADEQSDMSFDEIEDVEDRIRGLLDD